MGSSKSPGGKQVTITVRETKTERMTPVNQSHPGKKLAMTFLWLFRFIWIKITLNSFSDDQEVIRQVIHSSNASGPRASSATKELDDLMASLSDFKVSQLIDFSNNQSHENTQ